MSIIIEALKKAQSDLQEKDAAATPRTVWSSTPSEKPAPATQRTQKGRVPKTPAASDRSAQSPGKWKWPAIILLEICVFGVIAAILFVFQPRLFSLLSSSGNPSPQTASLKRPATVSAKPVPPRHPQPPAAAAMRINPPSLARLPQDSPVLNGIMMIDNKRVALINDEIYEVGDYIDGKKITDITLEKVELSDGKARESLSVRPTRSR